MQGILKTVLGLLHISDFMLNEVNTLPYVMMIYYTPMYVITYCCSFTLWLLRNAESQ